MINSKMIGIKIAEARKKAGISQAQLSQQLFISPQAVGKWERGESMPDITTFNRMAEILGVDLNFFSEDFQFSNKEPDPNTNSVDQAETLLAEKGKKRPSWDMSGGNWVDADFSGLKNLHEKFSSSNLQRCKFVSSDLSGLLLKSNHVGGCDFSNCDISGSQILSSQVIHNLFKDSSLKETELLRSYIKSNDFSGANFTGASIKSSSFRQNIMTNAVLNSTSFIATDIANIVFDGTLTDCYFENCTFSKVTFQNSTLINTFFKNKSLKGVRFIDCQADRMTFEILKSGKANMNAITLLK
jgi:uncharacterized protein YjbI with pentapeptide repeats